jgi:antitoxin HicB
MEPYLALFEPDRKAGGYLVTFPDFGYGATQGETEKEAMEMAQDLLALTIADYIRQSKPLPAPRRHRGSKFHPVPLPALQAKVDLYTAFLESGLKKAEFARRAGIHKTHVECLFSPRHRSRRIRSRFRLSRSASACTSKRATRLKLHATGGRTLFKLKRTTAPAACALTRSLWLGLVILATRTQSVTIDNISSDACTAGSSHRSGHGDSE